MHPPDGALSMFAEFLFGEGVAIPFQVSPVEVHLPILHYRLDVFSADIDFSVHVHLPIWESAEEITGDLVEMHGAVLLLEIPE